MHTTFYPEELKGKHHLEDIGIDGKLILTRSSGKTNSHSFLHYLTILY
jgi:hypothetical protein